MNATADLPLFSAGERIPVVVDELWYHGALCRLALPVRAPNKGSWQREAAGAVVHIEAGEGASLPSGRLLRLLLIAICDAAHRSDSAVIDLGETPAVLAQRLGLETTAPKLRDLTEQLQRLLAAKLTLAWDGGPTLSVFDARGRSRTPVAGWRATVRLTARLKASLAEQAVALQRDVVVALVDSPLALDLYAWLAAVLPAEGTELVASHAQLQVQFGAPSQVAPEFVATLAPALQQVQQVWPAFAATMREDAIAFRRTAAPAKPSAPARPQSEARPAGKPVPVPELPAPEPVEFLPAAEPEDPELDLAADLEAVLTAEAEARVAAVANPSPMPESVPSPAPTLAPSPVPVSEQVEPRRPLRQAVSLKPHLTGLPQVVWLQRANGREIVVIEVTPGGRYDPEQCTVIALEPVALQIVGGLYARDFERVAAWAAANRDLIDDFWESNITDFEEVQERVRKVPAPAWR